MKTYLISYDLLKPGQDYSTLYETIKKLADGWWHDLQSVWLINSSLSAAQVRDQLKAHVDVNDKLLVVVLGNDWATWNLTKAGNDWLANHSRFVPANAA
jgi:hypothetical protein